jgi:hypothetical protein
MSSYYAIPEQESYVRLPKYVQPGDLQFIGHLFATDGEHIFSTRGVLKDANAATFKVVEESSEPDVDGTFFSAYAVTKAGGVFVDQLNAPRAFKTPAPLELRSIAAHFATDGKAVFRDGVKVNGANVNSFRPISSVYSADDDNCFYCAKRIEDASPSSFRPLGNDIAYLSCDSNAVYLHEMAVLPILNSKVELLRESRGYVIGLFDGEREWSIGELDTIYRKKSRKVRSVNFDESRIAALRYSVTSFVGLEGDVSMFLMMCNHKTIESLEQFTRGKRGEKALVRAIESLNQHLQSPLANISAEAITVTPEGLALYRQFGAVVDQITDFTSLLRLGLKL